MAELNNNLIFYNARIHTMESRQPLASALAIQNDKIVFVGDDASARGWFPKGNAEEIDLLGACILPGLVDAHLHFLWFSESLQQVNVETPTHEEALRAVAEFASKRPAGSWVTGTGWNHNVWGGEFPTAADLDRVVPDHPVLLEAKSGHATWVNTRALELAGITAATHDPAGGQIVRDAHGKPTGVLLEGSAGDLVRRVVPEPALDERMRAMRAGIAAAHAAGLTGVHDMDPTAAFETEEALHARGELTLRVVKSIPLDRLQAAVEVGLRTGFGDDWLRIGGVKMFADGALGPRTAWMLAGFDSDPANTGISATPLDILRDAVLLANRHGLAADIHAIGDRANREVLDIYVEARRQQGDTGLRNRIEHVQLIDGPDAPRLAALGVIASMQPLHATSDMLIAVRHWGARTVGAYALKTQLDCGAVLALGSDCPVETLDPLAGIHAAVTRRRADGSPGPDGWHPEQRITVDQAVRGYTWGPAYAAGLEDRLGSLAPGKLADLTVLDRDIFAIDPMDILQVKVLGTMTGGVRRFWAAS